MTGTEDLRLLQGAVRRLAIPGQQGDKIGTSPMIPSMAADGTGSRSGYVAASDGSVTREARWAAGSSEGDLAALERREDRDSRPAKANAEKSATLGLG